MMTKYLFGFVAACTCLSSADAESSNTTVDINASAPDREVSPMLTGVNVLHHLATDQVLADGRVAGYLKEMHSGILRYPGGEVSSYYHWELPGWPGWKDAWESNKASKVYLSPQEAARNTNFLNTDKYIALCRKVGAEPMIGVNLESGIIHDRVKDSLDEAVRWVKYCKVRGYNVKYWFIDNESYLRGSYTNMSAEAYGKYVKLFGGAMKAADPGIKIAGNWHGHFASPASIAECETVLKNAGDALDILDVHCYWAHGRASWDLWLRQTPVRPMYPGSQATSYTDEFNRFHAIVKRLGLKTQIGVFEWNIGPNKNGPLPSPFECALVQSELLFQFAEGGAVIGCFWPLHWPGNPRSSGTYRHLLEPSRLEPNPTFQVFKLFSNSLGERLAPSSSTDTNLLTLSSLSNDGKTLHVYLVRKSNGGADVNTAIRLKGFSARSAEVLSFTSGSDSSPNLKKAKIESRGDSWQYDVPGKSFSALTFIR